VIGGLLLALGSAALINIGFLLQHRGLRGDSPPGAAARLRRALRSRSWRRGQALGWAGFAAQIVAVAIAPLSLVQAFAAGGLALSVPLAAGVCDHRITRQEVVAILVIAAGLAALPVGFSTARDRPETGALIVAVALAAPAGLAISAVSAAWARAVAAGIFYGVADAAIKAISLDWQRHGAAALLSGWTAAAAVGTFAGFLALQSALAKDGPVAAISVMNALAALVALACGLGAFGESLGSSAGLILLHVVGIGVILAGVPVLAGAQAAMAQSAAGPDQRPAARRAPVPAA
jgi:hypothetical protein